MGFSIGRFLGSVAGPVIGALVPGPLGQALGGGVSAGFGSVPGRAAAPAPAAGGANFAQVPPLSSTVPVPNRISFAGLPSTTSLSRIPSMLGRAGSALSFFDGGSSNGGGRGGRLQTILASARAATGGPVTRNGIIDAAKVCGLETAASTFGISVEDVCFMVVRGRTRRRRGISAADIRRTKRTIRFVKSLRKDLVAVKGR